MVYRSADGLPTSIWSADQHVVCRSAVSLCPSRRFCGVPIPGAGFTLLYLDDDLRMHRTFDGQYFVQQRTSSGPK